VKLMLERWNAFLKEGEDMARVSKAVMFDDEGKLLILKRAPRLITELSPWEWDLPGGHVNKGEKDMVALAREIKEETSLFISRAPDWYMLDKDTRFYLLREWSGEIMLSDEHSEYKWVEPKEASNYNIGKRYLKAIKEAAARL